MNKVTSRHALGLLIEAIKKSRRWSDEDVARRARSRGHEMSKSNISRIRTQPVDSINPAQMHALADGLGLPVENVLQAALTSMGLPAGEARGRFEDVVKSDPNLIPDAKDHLLKQYALLLRVTGEEPVPLQQGFPSHDEITDSMSTSLDRLSEAGDSVPASSSQARQSRHRK